jgi:hypothetical protein
VVFYQSLVTSSLLSLFSHTPSLRSSLNVSDQVSHPYKTTCKITVLYILIFKLQKWRFNTDLRKSFPTLPTAVTTWGWSSHTGARLVLRASLVSTRCSHLGRIWIIANATDSTVFLLQFKPHRLISAFPPSITSPYNEQTALCKTQQTDFLRKTERERERERSVRSYVIPSISVMHQGQWLNQGWPQCCWCKLPINNSIEVGYMPTMQNVKDLLNEVTKAKPTALERTETRSIE